ncbi:hypothetical protein [Saccharopolyspora hattusasensis]|uniref:hypothetical protein n=1 Tax=Saccharopolyspora hattusasensis TaxID=1128679 RepID=UPI003D99C57C
MSGEHRRTGAPQGPPWSLDLLADLHAGVLDQQTADQLRVQVQDDPEARDILAALDATSSDLAALPPLTIPDDVSARIDAALENEVRAWAQQQAAAAPPAEPVAPPAEQDGQVIDFAAAKQRRRRRFTLGAGLAGVAAAAAAVVFSVLPSNTDTSGSNQAQPAATGGAPAPLALRGEQVTLNGEQFGEIMKSEQYSSTLTDPQRLIGCLQANGVNSGKPLGAREITLNGKPAQLLVLQGGAIGKFRLLAVGPECGPGNPAKVSDSTFGG